QSGPANHDGKFLSPLNVGDNLPRLFTIDPRVIFFIEVPNVDEVMRNGLKLGLRRLCGANIEVFVDLAGISGDNFSVELLCEKKRERCFTRGRRADKYEGGTQGKFAAL
ncbi:MAG: hypothetical protein WEB62_02240, partial [Bacteroidota bacterium]